jgi:hypothetical protein
MNATAHGHEVEDVCGVSVPVEPVLPSVGLDTTLLGMQEWNEKRDSSHNDKKFPHEDSSTNYSTPCTATS